MEEEVKRISQEKLDYYREHIEECPVDVLRILYVEKEESEKYLYDAYQDAGKKMFEYAEQLENSVPKSKIKEKLEVLKTKLNVFEKDIRYCKDRVQTRLMNDEIYVIRRCLDLLQELMEEN